MVWQLEKQDLILLSSTKLFINKQTSNYFIERQIMLSDTLGQKILRINRYLLHRIILSYTAFRSLKMKNFNIKTRILLTLRGWKLVLTKLVLNFIILIFVCNTILYMIFQFDWEPVLIQLILIGFEAILEIFLCHTPELTETQTK